MPEKTTNVTAQIREFFGYPTLAAFAKDWRALDSQEKAQITGGVKDGTYDYAV